jgi:hypothetical protein
MSGNISKQTMTLIHNASKIGAAAQVHGPEAARRLSEQLGGKHDAFDAAALLQQLDGQRWYIEAVSQVLRDAEQGLIDELADNPGIREELGESLAAVRGDIIQARELSRGLYETPALVAMGFVGEVPEDASALMVYGRTVLGGLRSQNGKPGRLGLTVELKPLIDGLEASLARLKVAHEVAVADVREDQVARLKRDEAFVALRLVYRSAALLLEGYFRQAGLSDLADRLRPTERRAQGLEEGGEI